MGQLLRGYRMGDVNRNLRGREICNVDPQIGQGNSIETKYRTLQRNIIFRGVVKALRSNVRRKAISRYIE